MKSLLLFLSFLLFISCSQERIAKQEECSYPDFRIGNCPLENIIYRGQWEWLSHYYAQDSIGFKMSHWDDEQHKTIFYPDTINLFDTDFVISNISPVENGIGIFCLLQHGRKDVYFKEGMGAYFIVNDSCEIIAVGKHDKAVYFFREPREDFTFRFKNIFTNAIKKRQSSLSPCFQEMLENINHENKIPSSIK